MCTVFSLSRNEKVMGSIAWSYSMQESPCSLQALIMKVWDGQRLENWYSVELSSNCGRKAPDHSWLEWEGTLLMPANQLAGPQIPKGLSSESVSVITQTKYVSSFFVLCHQGLWRMWAHI